MRFSAFPAIPFILGKIIFVILDNAGNEELDLMQSGGWLERILQDAQQYDNRLVFMHMPLYDPRGETYHQCLPAESAKRLKQLFLHYNVTHIFTSNIPAYFQESLNGIPLFINGGAGAKLKGTDPNHYFFHFLKVDIRRGRVEVHTKAVPRPSYVRMDHLRYNLSYSYHYLKIHFIAVILSLAAGSFAFFIYRSESRKRKVRLIHQYPVEY